MGDVKGAQISEYILYPTYTRPSTDTYFNPSLRLFIEFALDRYF